MTSNHAEHRSALDRFLFDWFAPETLGVVRLYFGIGLALYTITQYPQLFILDMFGPQFHFTMPIWYFRLFGIEENVPWLAVPVMLGTLAACLFFAFGKWTKPAIIVIILGTFYLKGVRDSFSGDIHHREVPIFAILVLFLLSKCDQIFGIDARRRDRTIERWESSWPLRAMQIYIAMFYFWALVAKLRVSGLYWFQGGGYIQEILVERALRDGIGVDGNVVNLSLSWQVAQQPDLVFLFGVCVFLFELFVPLILFIKDWKVRLAVLLCATAFHFSNYLLMNVQFYFYPFVFIVFFDIAIVHQWLKERLRLRERSQPMRPT